MIAQPTPARILALGLLAACGEPDPPAPPAAPTPASDGHERMAALLRDKADWARRESRFFGDARNRKLLEDLAALPAGAEAIRRWAPHLDLGFHELRVGRNERAIEHLLAARSLLPGLPKAVASRKARDTSFWLGVAYLRWGETQNCVARHTSQSCLLPIEGSGVHQNQEGSRKAIAQFTEALRIDPEFLAARWLLNIAAMTVGEWPDRVAAAWRIDPARLRSDEPFPRFVDIAPKLGLNTFDTAGGAVADDLDNDGLLDLVTSSWDLADEMHVFRNRGDGTFANRTAEAGLRGFPGGLNLVQADYDNDGFVDLLVLRGAWQGQEVRLPHSLLRNTGGGRFRDVTFDAGLAQARFPSQTAAWADYDLDGDLDLFVGNEHAEGRPSPSQLFRNDGHGRFTDVARDAGVENLRFAKGAAWGDVDDDRFPDLYVSNLGSDNRLFKNNGDGTFADVAQAAGVTRPAMSFPTWFWDFDNDGALDLFVSSYWYRDLKYFLESFFGKRTEAEPACLYKGDGRGGFREVGAAQGLGRVLLPMGANFGDLDNDGFLDFYLGTGFPAIEALMPNVMYRNRGGRGFSDVTTAGGFGHLQKGHGVAFADLDNDGDQDVFEQMGGAYPVDAFGDTLYENPGFGRHWVKLLLIGRRSNRSAIGARVRLQIMDAGKRRSIYRHVGSGGSFGANPLRQEIGLGGATSVEVLEVFWPASNTTQVFRDVAADRFFEITEGATELRALPLARSTFR